MLNQITEEMSAGYLENNAEVCPFCDFSNIVTTGRMFNTRYEIVYHMVCKDCLEVWDEIFTLDRIQDRKE